jgi:hypothetical protein
MLSVDFVANIMPWAGSLIPATLTVLNLMRNLKFELLPALLIGAVIEGIGFVSVTTAIDLYELRRAEHESQRATSWAAPVKMDGAFWVAVGGAAVYLVAVLSINAILDDGDIWRKVTLALLSLFGVIGGVNVALRNQLHKRRVAFAKIQDDAAERQASAERDAQSERERQASIELEREREQRAHAYAMEQERVRLEHETEMAKLEADNLRKLEKARADSARKASEMQRMTPENAPDKADGSPDGKDIVRRWPDVSPDDYGWIVDAPAKEIVKRYKLTGKDPERVARSWKGYAKAAKPADGAL